MIRYSLQCDRTHSFDVWFKNSADYDKQRKRGLVSCPACGSSAVEKALMAPQLGRGSRKGKPATTESSDAPQPVAAPMVMSPQESELRAKLKEFREHLTCNADDVGKSFPDEARKMHYGETEHRSIYGQASMEDAKDMLDEGIEFHPLPILPEDRN